MIVKKNIDKEKGWLLDDGKNPIQLRVVVPEEIGNVVHYHKTMHEYFLVLQGEMKIKIDDQVLDLRPGGLVVVEPGEAHVILSCTPDARILLLMPPPVANDKIEM